MRLCHRNLPQAGLRLPSSNDPNSSVGLDQKGHQTVFEVDERTRERLSVVDIVDRIARAKKQVIVEAGRWCGCRVPSISMIFHQ